MLREEPFRQEKLRVLIHCLIVRQCASRTQSQVGLDKMELDLLCVGYDSRALWDEHAVVHVVGHVKVRKT